MAKAWPRRGAANSISYGDVADQIVIASACKADQYGWDYLNLGNTPWGKYSVDEGTLQGLADDGDPETTVSVEEANTYACPLVTAEQPDSEPQILDHDPGERIP